MNAKRILASLVIGALGAAAAHAVSARYFFSLGGLSDPNNPDSPAISPTNFGFDLIGPNSIIAGSNDTTRLYLWAELSTPGPVDLKGINLAFRTTGGVTIEQGLIWQNNYTLPGIIRWNPQGVPGMFVADGTGQFTDPTPSVAVLEQGISDGALSQFDDQYVPNLRSAVFGYLEVRGTNGDVHIINQGSGFLQIGGPMPPRITLGFGDLVGNEAEVPGFPYDTPEPEATLVIPEPMSLALLGFAGLLTLRRR